MSPGSESSPRRCREVKGEPGVQGCHGGALTQADVTEGRSHITPTPAALARFGPAVKLNQSSLPEEATGQGQPLRCHQMTETGTQNT